MEIFALVGLLTAYFNYRNAKAAGSIEPKPQITPVEPCVQKPLRPAAGPRARIADWLGLEDE